MALKPWVQTRVKPSLVQILVVVANKQVTTLLTDVDTGSMGTVIGHGLVDPEE